MHTTRKPSRGTGRCSYGHLRGVLLDSCPGEAMVVPQPQSKIDLVARLAWVKRQLTRLQQLLALGATYPGLRTYRRCGAYSARLGAFMSKQRATVLIVEDDFIIALGAAELLKDAGYDTVETSNADDAVRILASG